MPYFFKISSIAKIVVIRHIGMVSIQDICDQLAEIMTHKEFRPGLNLLIDQREEISPKLVQKLRNIDDQENAANKLNLQVLFPCFKNIKVARIIDENFGDHFDDLVTLLEENETIEHAVFLDINEAKTWLEIPHSYDVEEILEKIISLPATNRGYFLIHFYDSIGKFANTFNFNFDNIARLHKHFWISAKTNACR